MMNVQRFIQKFCSLTFAEQADLISYSRTVDHIQKPICIGDSVIVYDVYKCIYGGMLYYVVTYKNGIVDNVKASTTNNIF